MLLFNLSVMLVVGFQQGGVVVSVHVLLSGECLSPSEKYLPSTVSPSSFSSLNRACLPLPLCSWNCCMYTVTVYNEASYILYMRRDLLLQVPLTWSSWMRRNHCHYQRSAYSLLTDVLGKYLRNCLGSMYVYLPLRHLVATCFRSHRTQGALAWSCPTMRSASVDSVVAITCSCNKLWVHL